MRIAITMALALYGVAAGAGEDLARLGVTDAKQCMEGPLAQFGRYIGDWVIADEVRSRETGEFEAGEGARWNFVCIGNGTAIQDFWFADGKTGTNLRTYNTENGKWDIAWAIEGTPGFAHIRAQHQEDDSIVMHYVAPLPDPLRRITFYPPDRNGWHWKLEFSTDGGENWTEVYRIRATRATAEARGVETGT